ncbi:helix-turn-helix domain-containing protein [Streptomyces sp. NPDC001381]|uniref:helix-turn-helix domain-containing protein n=1 Tax=Streptomyces sp. NPDC001381 TaxID=3364567 RepID=UPI0036ABA997
MTPSGQPAVPLTPPVPLAALLAREELALRQIAGPAGAGTVLHGAHTSEMADPYPYLLGGELLLTAGVHIPQAAGAGSYFDDYVARIVAAGGAALGFGVAPVHDTVPRALVAACEAHGLPLIEVPPQTTFATVARAVWQLMERARTAELRRVTEAQQSLASAAARPDPVRSVLRRLAHRLGGRAVLYAPDGTEITTAGPPPATPPRTPPETRPTRPHPTPATPPGRPPAPPAPQPDQPHGTPAAPVTPSTEARPAPTPPPGQPHPTQGTPPGRPPAPPDPHPDQAHQPPAAAATELHPAPAPPPSQPGPTPAPRPDQPHQPSAAAGAASHPAPALPAADPHPAPAPPAAGPQSTAAPVAASPEGGPGAVSEGPGEDPLARLARVLVERGSASASDVDPSGTHLAAYALGAGRGFVLGVATPRREAGDHTIASVAAVLLSLLTGEHQSGSDAARSCALVRLLLGSPPEEVAPLLGDERWIVVHARPESAAPDPVAAAALGAALGSPLVDLASEVVRVLVPAEREPGPQPGWTLGVSAVAEPGQWPVADAQAARALARARATRAALVRHGGPAGLADLLPPDAAAEHARTLLAPVAATPALTETLRTWLSLHGSWDRTAVALAVHRNTVRQRIARCAALLGTDLDDPDVRMELWFALRVTDQ